MSKSQPIARNRGPVRRMRRMVISIHATVANYEYFIYWRFYADGNSSARFGRPV